MAQPISKKDVFYLNQEEQIKEKFAQYLQNIVTKDDMLT